MTEEIIREHLSKFHLEGTCANPVSEGLVSQIRATGGRIQVTLRFTTQPKEAQKTLEEGIRKHLYQMEGVRSVMVVGTQAAAPPAPPLPSPAAPHAHPHPPAGRHSAPTPEPIPGVKYVVAVASGKGGVGKSTVAVNLACALQRLGLEVGILDADVYGPSLPLMLQVEGKLFADEDKKIIPLTNYGLKIMSIGFAVDDNSPVIWRGPIATGIIRQFLRDVAWGELDVLVLDLPPGTGDVHLTVVQTVPVTGAVVVTTPQDIALLDAKKGFEMFGKVNVPVFGIVENMSYYVCPKCGNREEIFAHGGGAKTSEGYGVEFLGEIPLDLKVRVGGDEGIPIVVQEPNGPIAKAFLDMARRVLTHLPELKAH